MDTETRVLKARANPQQQEQQEQQEQRQQQQQYMAGVKGGARRGFGWGQDSDKHSRSHPHR